MDELALKVSRQEHSEWQEWLLGPLQRSLPESFQVRMKVGGGLLLMVEGEGERLVMQIGDRSIFEDGYYIFDSSVLRYIGRDISERARPWLEMVGDQLGRLHRDPEKSVRWQSFLSWASVQPSRAFGVHGGEQTYQGEELLIRLLEPCQARCSFCICRSGQPDLVSSIDDVEERLVEGREHGMEIVVFTGGEPTLVRELPDLIRRAKELGYRTVGLQTNGIRLANRAYATQLRDAGLDRILQSLHSHQAETHEAIFQIEGCFDTCVGGARMAMALGLQVTLNFVTTIQNQGQHTDFVEFVHRELKRPFRPRQFYLSRYPSITFSVMSPQGWGAQHDQPLARLTDVAESVGRALVRARKLGLDVRIPGLCGFPPCLLPKHKRRFDELYEERPVRIQSRQLFETCSDCAFEQRCSGYWKGYVAQHGHSEFVPIPKGTSYPRRWMGGR